MGMTLKFDKKTYLAFGFLILLVLIFVLNKKVPLTPKNTVDSSEFIVQLSSSVGKVSFRSGPNSAQNTTPNYPENLLNKSELKTYEGSKAQLLAYKNYFCIEQ